MIGYSDAVRYGIEVMDEFNSGDIDLEDMYAEGDVRWEYIDRVLSELPG